MDHSFYAKQFDKAKIFSEEDFTNDMTKGSVIGLIVGFCSAVLGAYGVVNGAQEAWKFLAGGLLMMLISVAYQCFPRFRKVFDGGSHGDISDRELEGLINRWDQSGVATQHDLGDRESIAFYGKPNGMTLYAIVRINDKSAKPDDKQRGTYLFAHYNVFRKNQNKKSKTALWAPLSVRFEGSDAELVEYLENLNDSVIATLIEMSKTHNFKTMPDPIDLPPLDQLVCAPKP